ncbi:hypothetical protein IQ265_27030 [Nodosilinea sp. LEGE 06152]|uniref:hypothetical protein n=1 Tax=Nodosilinea sp. LEGE 06152 TaxID=2777966 RepID=UPI001882EBA1|nr:hypothetical protein [Nodosilinea sp. LEGE 06152]MBE9160448.1 hypothetical protein [Nodosilinea sp. LEGE 06152]
MLLRLLLIASALTPLILVGSTFWSTTFRATGSDTLNPVASCAPTQPDDDEDDDDEKPRRPTRGRFS